MEDSRLRVWIDATSPQGALSVFGMSLLERQLRTIIEAGLTPSEVCACLPEAPLAPRHCQKISSVHCRYVGSRASEPFPAQLAAAMSNLS